MCTGAVCVLLGGLVAGVVSEVVSEVVLPLEEKGLAASLLHWKHSTQPQPQPHQSSSSRSVLTARFFRGIGPSVFSTMLGFVAFEYAKDIHFNASGDSDGTLS
jgi:hypothetical protein